MKTPSGLHRIVIVIVGGGAGGLELATRLGRTLGRTGRAHITLIEKARTHFWKPHLHEIAAGSIDVHEHATDYLAQSHWNGFRYRVGQMTGLDRAQRLVHVGPVLDEDGRPVTQGYARPYDTLVMAVDAQGVQLAGGERVDAELVVWAAGVKAPAFLAGLDGLETNRINQLVVGPTLQTTRDERVFALGDCAAAPWLGREAGVCVPPRAQAAHQQASHLARELPRACKGAKPRPWRYRDFGSLVSLGEYSTVGNLMGALVGGNLWVEGLFARTMYLSLYKMHEVALHGWWKTALGSASRWLTRGTDPRVKLH